MWKKRLTNYNFWISMISAVLLILQAFNINFDIVYINEIATAVLGLLVVIGIISNPTRTSTDDTKKATENVKDPNNVQKAEVNTIPTNEQNEIDYANIQNDFKVLIEQITHDFEKMNQENIAILNSLKSQNTERDVEAADSINAIESNEAVATSYNIVN